MSNALPYILLVLFYIILTVISYYKSRSRFIIEIISIVVFILFFGFRGFIFYDWSSYYPAFESLPDIFTLFTQDWMKWGWEPGFILFASIIKELTNSYQFFILLCTVINTLLLTRFFKLYIAILPLGFMMYLTMNGIQISTDLLRNSIAICIFLNAIPYIQQRKLIPYMSLCLLAATFHSSALAYIPLYFFLDKKLNIWIALTLFIGANIIYLFHIPILKSFISIFVGILMPSTKLWIDSYLNMDATTGSTLSIGYLERLLTATLVFCYYNRLIEKRNSPLFVNATLIFLIIFLLFSEFRTISMRTSTLFSFGYWIVWIDLIDCFKYKNNKILFVLFVCLYSIIKTYSNCSSDVARYENILFGASNFNERLVEFRKSLSK